MEYITCNKIFTPNITPEDRNNYKTKSQVLCIYKRHFTKDS